MSPQGMANNAHSPTPAAFGSGGGPDMANGPTNADPSAQDPTSASRLLEQAVATADQLVAESRAEADSLVAAARAEADAISQAARTEADRVAAELDRAQEQQKADLERERALTLAGLEQERTALEGAIARLRQVQGAQREQMRAHLEDRIRLLDAALPEGPTAVVD